MMSYVGLNDDLKTDIWPKYVETVTKLENIWYILTKKNARTRSSTKNARLRNILKYFCIVRFGRSFDTVKENLNIKG